jgi:hypothetical protein
MPRHSERRKGKVPKLEKKARDEAGRKGKRRLRM